MQECVELMSHRIKTYINILKGHFFDLSTSLSKMTIHLLIVYLGHFIWSFSQKILLHNYLRQIIGINEQIMQLRLKKD